MALIRTLNVTGDNLPAEVMPVGYQKGVAGGLAALNIDGEVVDAAGNRVTGSGQLTAETPADDDISTRIATTEWVAAHIIDPVQRPLNDVIEEPCYGGVFRTRTQITGGRTDLRICWLAMTRPPADPAYAWLGDYHRFENW